MHGHSIPVGFFLLDLCFPGATVFSFVSALDAGLDSSKESATYKLNNTEIKPQAKTVHYYCIFPLHHVHTRKKAHHDFAFLHQFGK